MKTKSLVLFGVLIIALAAMAVPVMAADSGSATTAVSGTISKSVTITSLGGTTSIDLSAGTGSPTAAATFDASENCAGYITAVDDYATYGKPATSAGFMSNYSAGSFVAAPVTHLNSLISVLGTTKAPFTTAGSAGDLSTASNIFTFSSIGSATGITMTFTQPLSSSLDVALPGSNSYRIPVLVTIACA